MKCITQTELVNLIKAKQENAKNSIEALGKKEGWKIEDGLEKTLSFERNKAYIDAYADVIALIDSAKIVVSPEMTSISQTQKPHEIRDDRFIEFVNEGLGRGTKEMVDAKSIQFIRFFKSEETYIVEIWCGCGFITNKTFVELPRAIAYYNELVEWWKYWEQN